jgi:hypothetical protein
MPLRKTEEFQAVKTRGLIMQNVDGSYPVAGSVATVVDEYGRMGFTQDLCANAVTLTSGEGDITLTTDGAQLLVDGVPVGGGGGVTSVDGSGAGISVSPTTGAVVVQNTGVTSLAAGTGAFISAPTGAVTVFGKGNHLNIDGSLLSPGTEVQLNSGSNILYTELGAPGSQTYRMDLRLNAVIINNTDITFTLDDIYTLYILKGFGDLSTVTITLPPPVVLPNNILCYIKNASANDINVLYKVTPMGTPEPVIGSPTAYQCSSPASNCPTLALFWDGSSLNMY